MELITGSKSTPNRGGIQKQGITLQRTYSEPELSYSPELVYEGLGYDRKEDFLNYSGVTTGGYEDTLQGLTEAWEAYEEDDSVGLSDEVIDGVQLSLKPSRKVGGISGFIFTGGGAKGIVYVGVLQVLEKYGLLIDANKFGGSSAGSITSVLAACLTFTAQKGSLFRYIDGLRNSGKKKAVSRSRSSIDEELAGVTKLTDAELHESVAFIKWRKSKFDWLINQIETTSFSDFKDWDISSFSLSRIGAFKGDRFLVWLTETLSFLLTFEGSMLLTFQEFGEMTGVDLAVTATRYIEPQTDYFSTRTTKNVSVVAAVRASMSIQGAFKPHSIYDPDKKTTISYGDGGYFDNFPLTIYDFFGQDGSLYAYNTQIIGFNLVEEPKEPIEDLENVSFEATAQITTFIPGRNFIHKYKERGSPYWLRACHIPIFNDDYNTVQGKRTKGRGPVETMEFDMASPKKRSLIKTAQFQTQKFLFWIVNRISSIGKFFPLKPHLLSGSYRERVLIDSIKELRGRLDEFCESEDEPDVKLGSICGDLSAELSGIVNGIGRYTLTAHEISIDAHRSEPLEIVKKKKKSKAKTRVEIRETSKELYEELARDLDILWNQWVKNNKFTNRYMNDPMKGASAIPQGFVLMRAKGSNDYANQWDGLAMKLFDICNVLGRFFPSGKWPGSVQELDS